MAEKPNHPLMMIQAEIATGKATIRSLGVLYCVAMASRPIGRGTIEDDRLYWEPINLAIGEYLKPEGSFADRMMATDKVKKIGWDVYEAVAAMQGEEDA